MDKDQYYQGNLNTNHENNSVNAKELVLKYLHHGWLFVIMVILSLTIAWLYLRYTKPSYSVSSTLLIRNDNMNRGGGAGSSQDMFSDIALFQSNTNKQNEILILNSRTIMERVVKSLDLQRTYSVVGNVVTKDIYPSQPFQLEIIQPIDSTQPIEMQIHFDQNWQTFTLNEDKEKFTVGQEVSNEYGRFKIVLRESFFRNLSFRDFVAKWRPIEMAATYFASSLSVRPANELSNVLELNYTNENPLLATAIINELMVQYNNDAIEVKNETNRKILSFITDRLMLVEKQLDSVEVTFQAFRSNKQVIDLPAQSEMYFGNMNELRQSQRANEVQLQVVTLLEEYISQPGNRLALVPSTLGLTDPTLLRLTESYNKLVSDRLIEIQTGATVNNPVVKNLEKNIEEARLKILQSLTNIKNVYSGNIQKLSSESSSLRKEISSIPEKERLSREKARQQEIKQNLYLYLLQKKEESEIAQASTIANSRILDTALPVFNKVSPIPMKIYGLALLIGLVVPVIFIYIRDLLSDKVTTRADISKVTDAPVLGEIGHSEEENVLLFPTSSRTIVAEQMRILRSNLRFVLGEKNDNPSILVTSSFSGEGKSFISTNLGATLAISGKRTVILEFDLRKPKILQGLGLPKGHGLTNYLVGGARLDEIVQVVPMVDNLFVIPCGPVPPNPSEILLTPKIEELFSWLRKNFDAVVIDTAPVGLVSDAFTLSQFADSTIYVIRQRYTYKRQVAFIDELYRDKKLPNIGLLVNDVIPEGSKGYYGYGSGRYGYGYGYGMGSNNGYYEESRRKSRYSLMGMFGKTKH